MMHFLLLHLDLDLLHVPVLFTHLLNLTDLVVIDSVLRLLLLDEPTDQHPLRHLLTLRGPQNQRTAAEGVEGGFHGKVMMKVGKQARRAATCDRVG